MKLRPSSILFRLLLASFAVSACLACDDPPEEPAESPDPVVAPMELPISLRRESQGPSGAARIEVAPGRMRLDGHTLFEMQGAHVPESEIVNHVITKLKAGLDTGAGHSSAILRIYAATPWSTTLAILDTLQSSNIRQVSFEVRPQGAADIGYLTLGSYEVVDASEEIVPFTGAGQRTWDDFKAHWQEIHDACRQADYVDCAYVPQNIAEGGQAQMTLFARGNAVKVQFDRFGAEDAESPARPELLEGVPQAADAVAEEDLPPAVTAAFTWRARALTKSDSPIKAAMRGMCGTEPCAAVVTAEGQTPTMRLVSFFGAVYPDGAPAPILRFVRNAPGR